MEFKVHDDRDSKESGITHFCGEGRIIIYLQHHETLTDIYSTITHESIQRNIIMNLIWIHIRNTT